MGLQIQNITFDFEDSKFGDSVDEDQNDNVYDGIYYSQIRICSVMGLEIRLVNDTLIQYFDQYNVCLGIDLDIKDELMFLNIKEWRIVNDLKDSPIINEVGLSKEQY